MDVSLVLTHDCNFRCSYCYMGEKTRRPMSDEVARQSVELAFSDDAEKVQVSFFGGEPLLRWEQIVENTALAKRLAEEKGRRLLLTVTTNGSLLTRDRLRWLMAEGFFLGLSIDGVREAQDAARRSAGGKSTFDEVSAALDLCLAEEAWFETISVIDPSSVRWLPQTVRWLVEKDVPRISLNPNFSATWSDEDLALWEAGYVEAGKLYAERHRTGKSIYINIIEDKILTHIKDGYGTEDKCKLGHGSLAVAPSGNLYPCERMVADDSDDWLCIGHVARGVEPSRLGKLDEAKTSTTNTSCTGCAVEHRCMSFCACANLSETGKLGEAGGIQCWHEQTALRVADAVGNELWRQRDKNFIARIYGYEE